MTTEWIHSLITTIGFPIAMCIVLLRYINTTQKQLIESMQDISRSIAVLCTKVEDVREVKE